MGDFNKIEISSIKVGMCFSAPVFFEDGRNMFLAAGMQAKSFHIKALKQWKIPFLLTKGIQINPSEAAEIIARVKDTRPQEVEYLTSGF